MKSTNNNLRAVALPGLGMQREPKTRQMWRCSNPDCYLGMIFAGRIGQGQCTACKGGSIKCWKTEPLPERPKRAKSRLHTAKGD